MKDLKERLGDLNPWRDTDWPEVVRKALARIEALEAELMAAKLEAIKANEELRAALDDKPVTAAEYADFQKAITETAHRVGPLSSPFLEIAKKSGSFDKI